MDHTGRLRDPRSRVLDPEGWDGKSRSERRRRRDERWRMIVWRSKTLATSWGLSLFGASQHPGISIFLSLSLSLSLPSLFLFLSHSSLSLVLWCAARVVIRELVNAGRVDRSDTFSSRLAAVTASQERAFLVRFARAVLRLLCYDYYSLS